jgi:cytochrome c
MRIRSIAIAIFPVVMAACANAPGPVALSEGPIARGYVIADRNCSQCHAVGADDRSRHPDAIPFRDLSQLYPIEGLEESLVEGLMTGHADMPEFQFSAEAANDLMLYLESIQTAP